MEITRSKEFYLIKGVFPRNVVCGFTGKDIAGTDIPEFSKTLKKEFSPAGFAYLDQKHSPVINYISSQGVYEGDGIFTGRKGLCLIIKTADCLPLYFYGNKRGNTGLIHMGWRPAAKGILENLKPGLDDFSLIAGVGLRKCCFRVKEDFLSNRILASCVNKRGNSVFFDPVKFARSGIKTRDWRLTDINICSFCDNRFYSWRRDRTLSRTLSFILNTG